MWQADGANDLEARQAFNFTSSSSSSSTERSSLSLGPSIRTDTRNSSNAPAQTQQSTSTAGDAPGASPSSTSPLSSVTSWSTPARDSSSSIPITSGSSPTAAAAASSSSNDGTIAGAVIGPIVAIAVIVGAYFAWARRKRRQRALRSRSNMSGISPHNIQRGKYFQEPAIAAVAPFGGEKFKLLPQRVEDAEIARRILMLTDQITLHVDNFYQDVTVKLDPNMEGRLSRFSTPYLPMPIAACLDAGYKPSVLIKHCLVFAIARKTVSCEDKRSTLMPPESENTATTLHDGTADFLPKGVTVSSPQRKEAAAYVQFDPVTDSHPLTQVQHDAINRFTANFEAAFRPWASDAKTRTKHLADVLNNAIAVASWLRLQPDTFQFDWNAGGDVRDKTGRNLVIVPAMYKIGHEGALLNQPKRLVDAQVQRM